MDKLTRRAHALAALALLVVVLSGCLGPESQYLLDATNRLRATNGRAALHEQEQVNARAQQWADTLAAQGRLRHSNLRTLPVPFRQAAENVGYGATIQQVHAMLAASPAHRANILNRAYTTVGIGTTRGRDGNIYAVEVFVSP